MVDSDDDGFDSDSVRGKESKVCSDSSGDDPELEFNEKAVEKLLWSRFPDLGGVELSCKAKDGCLYVSAPKSKWCPIIRDEHSTTGSSSFKFDPHTGYVLCKCFKNGCIKLLDDAFTKKNSSHRFKLKVAEKQEIFPKTKQLRKKATSKTHAGGGDCDDDKDDKGCSEIQAKMLEKFPPERFVVLVSEGAKIIDLAFNPITEYFVCPQWDQLRFPLPKEKRKYYKESDFLEAHIKELNDIGAGNAKMRRTYMEVWKKLPEVMTFHGEDFIPGGEIPGKNKNLNTWCGWPFEPRWNRTDTPDDVLAKVLYTLPHIGGDFDPVQALKDDPLLFVLWCEKELVCAGDVNATTWMNFWKARGIKAPWQVGDVAVGISGIEGTGKGLCLSKMYGELFGSHYVYANGVQSGTGKFNGHLKKALFVFVDEVDWPKGDANRNKALITNPVLEIEAKCQDIENILNCMKFAFAANDKVVVPAGGQSRRYLNFVMNPHYVNKHGKERYLFYSAWAKAIEAIQPELMYYYKNLSMLGFNPNRRPKSLSANLFSIKLETMDYVQNWWYECLNSGCIELQEWVDGETPTTFSKDLLYKSFREFVGDQNVLEKKKPKSSAEFFTQLWSFLDGCKVTKDKRQSVNSVRKLYAEFFNTLRELRVHFAYRQQTPPSIVFPKHNLNDEDQDEDFDVTLLPPKPSEPTSTSENDFEQMFTVANGNEEENGSLIHDCNKRKHLDDNEAILISPPPPKRMRINGIVTLIDD